ncbi:ribbon-helix-helix protein, CopG family [Candidatus Pacearchaeota archaeon]|nr:ribbon-helix-helix protein, CopG family [Candidatus Pacearchaeota archaeon]
MTLKTITIKLAENEAKELDKFVKEKKYLSKSEFIRHLIMEKLEKNRKEKIGWMILAEKSMSKIWDNKKDEEVWSKYL